MFEIIWGIFNLILLIAFLIISFKAVKLTKEKFGILSAVILTFGLLSLMSSNKTTKDSENIEFDITNSEKNVDKYPETYLAKTEIDKNLSSATNLIIKYSKKRDSIILLNAKSDRSGFVMATRWQPKMINLNIEKNNSYNYEVLGQIDWYLLGIRLTSQKRDYSGKINLK